MHDSFVVSNFVQSFSSVMGCLVPPVRSFARNRLSGPFLGSLLKTSEEVTLESGITLIPVYALKVDSIWLP